MRSGELQVPAIRERQLADSLEGDHILKQLSITAAERAQLQKHLRVSGGQSMIRGFPVKISDLLDDLTS
jgi:hypothetical protein